jgi:hypothetical protein
LQFNTRKPGDVALFADFGDVPIANITYNEALQTDMYSYSKLALVFENHTYPSEFTNAY